MNVVAFLVDITSHLNKSVRAFQKNLEVFSEDLQGECGRFPAVQDRVQRAGSSFVDSVGELIAN